MLVNNTAINYLIMPSSIVNNILESFKLQHLKLSSIQLM